ncbi:MAG: hypothetical protein EAZ90_03675 [Oscillatoriales cyanobacterium]|jgi:hypothetical protein|nr:MAG: hypothetical protein EAZ94_19160 [Oscillatoriales cyanobacterium]TAE21997.1 MAG: hypothetical protein EAZ93_19145 [Oscillatoriales cyanobacterium]TAE45288.1 MAG: hypothetical protein EAZ90_03675 [Oscillatoriales cyanobacterium]TAE72375.1 MAG: hypothetical protein EAZ86_01040 [Oscillatoriales cyanobacterium]TAF86827.1 MAG: hypothetical protein EAZ49_22050 [Oscillatoriales cyanobacterium]
MTIISHPALLPIDKNSPSTESLLSRSSSARDRDATFFTCENILKTLDREAGPGPLASDMGPRPVAATAA